MKMLFYLLVALSFSFAVVAQNNFFSLGTTWTYNNAVYPGLVPSTISVVGDTVIYGQPFLVLAGDCGCNVVAYRYVYAYDEKVVVYDELLDNFSLLYDFSLEGGESYTFMYGDASSNTVESVEIMIDSVGFIDAWNNDTEEVESLEVQYISIVQSPDNSVLLEWGDYIVKGVGSVGCMFPMNGVCDPHTGNIRCVKNEVGYHFYNGVVEDFILDCDETIVTLDAEDIGNELIELPLICVSPNPVEDQLFIDGVEDVDRVEVYSVLGERISSVVLTDNNSINVSHLSKGIYHIVVFGEEGKAAVAKIVKME